MPAPARAVVWAARAAWLVVAVAGGAAIGEALSGHSRAVQVAGTAAAWAGWAIGALALAVPGVIALTASRASVPASLIVAVAVIADGAAATSSIALLAPALVATALVGSAEFGRVYLQASAYGAEARFGLRPPIGYLLATVASWLVTATALVLTVPALAGRSWIFGTLCVAVAAFGLAVLPRRWHQLSRRWLVLVPAGIVVHDPVVLADTLMMPRRTIVALGVAGRGQVIGDAADLTGPTPGLSVEIVLDAPVSAALAPTRTHGDGTTIETAAIVVSPTRPGAALATAVAAGYPAPRDQP